MLISKLDYFQGVTEGSSRWKGKTTSQLCRQKGDLSFWVFGKALTLRFSQDFKANSLVVLELKEDGKAPLSKLRRIWFVGSPEIISPTQGLTWRAYKARMLRRTSSSCKPASNCPSKSYLTKSFSLGLITPEKTLSISMFRKSCTTTEPQLFSKKILQRML